jgi:hypothetical protein
VRVIGSGGAEATAIGGDIMKCRLLVCGALVGTALTLGATAPSSATMPASSTLIDAADDLRLDTEAAQRGGARAGGAARRTTVAGPRGGAARRTTVVGPGGNVARRTTVVGPGGNVARRTTAVGTGGAAVRRAGAGRYGAWVRPTRYGWAPGAAIAAGAAIGFVTAATAAAWAGPAPGPNLCWYYSDPSRTQGFWDACP